MTTILHHDEDGNIQSPMEGATRCPACYLPPEVKLEDDQRVLLRCARHGHMAMGNSVEQAVQHWNRYITFIKTDGVQNAVGDGEGGGVWTSVCLYCKVYTPSRQSMDSQGNVRVECIVCHLPKLERKAQ